VSNSRPTRAGCALAGKRSAQPSADGGGVRRVRPDRGATQYAGVAPDTRSAGMANGRSFMIDNRSLVGSIYSRDLAGLRFRDFSSIRSHGLLSSGAARLISPRFLLRSTLEHSMPNVSSSVGRVPTSDIKSTLRPIALAVQADLHEIGHDIALSQALELIAASFGFYKFQLMLRSNPQIQTSRSDSNEFSQFRPESVEARAIKLLAVDPIRAMRISALVVGRMRESGLVINALEAFFRDDDSSRTILSALASGGNGYELVNATTAMHSGQIAPLSAATPLVAPLPDRNGRLALWHGVLEFFNTSDVRLWRSPDTSLANNLEASRRDVFYPSPLGIGPEAKFGGTAELGLGFSLVTDEPFVNRAGVHTRSYSTWTPQWTYRSERGWWVEWHGSGWIHDPSKTGGLRSRPLPVNAADLPGVKLCPTCRQIYADGEGGALAHRSDADCPS